MNAVPVRTTLRAAGLVLAASMLAACGTMGPSQGIQILAPADGAIVGQTFNVRFGVKGMEVKPAGEMMANTGHHHLLINMDALPAGESVPFTDRHLHFGKGQTEAEVKLPPGTYKLTAQFGNGAHQSYGKPMSNTITITVK